MRTNPSSRIALLVLAAGASRRMGRSKALLPWHGKSVLAHHADTLAAVSGVDAWIITQPHDRPLADELDRVKWPAARRLINPDAPDDEMIESIRCGVRGILQHDYPGIGITPIDQVLTRPSTLTALAAASAAQPNRILQPAYLNRRGHPVMLPRTIAEALADFSGPTFRHFLEEQNEYRRTIDVDDAGVVTDMDTAEEYQDQLQRK